MPLCGGKGKVGTSREVRDLKRNVWDFTKDSVKCVDRGRELEEAKYREPC